MQFSTSIRAATVRFPLETKTIKLYNLFKPSQRFDVSFSVFPYCVLQKDNIEDALIKTRASVRTKAKKFARTKNKTKKPDISRSIFAEQYKAPHAHKHEKHDKVRVSISTSARTRVHETAFLQNRRAYTLRVP